MSDERAGDRGRDGNGAAETETTDERMATQDTDDHGTERNGATGATNGHHRRDRSRRGTVRRADGDGRLRVGVVGVGQMGERHVRVYSKLDDVHLVGVHDADEARARSVAADYGAAVMSRDELLRAVDAVTVAVPTESHYTVARTCIEHGVDVLVEKPFTATVEEGTELVELAADRDAVLQVGHIERFNPAIQQLKDLVDDMDPIAVEAKRLGPPRPSVPADGPVMDLMIHDIDIVLSLFGDVEEVRSVSARGKPYVTAQMCLDDGVVGTLTASRVTQKKIRTLEVTTAEALVMVDYIDQSVEIHRRSVPQYIAKDGDVRYRHEGIVEYPLVESAEPLRQELVAFVDAVRNGHDPPVTGEDGLRAIEVAGLIAGDQLQPSAPDAPDDPDPDADDAVGRPDTAAVRDGSGEVESVDPGRSDGSGSTEDDADDADGSVEVSGR